MPSGPINDLADVFADPQVIARGMKIDLPDPEAAGGHIPTVGSPIVLDGQRMVSAKSSPRLGADTEAVLADPNWTVDRDRRC